MGGHHSKTVTNYNVPDTLFVDIGCVGFTRKEYSSDKRLYAAPFYIVKITATTYFDLVNQVISAFSNPQLPPEMNPADARPLQPPVQIYGPVYLFAAYDPEKKIIEACLSFPSMHKDRSKWGTYFELGTYHRWMYRVIYSNMYSVKPLGACGMHVKFIPDAVATTDAAGHTTYQATYSRVPDGKGGYKPWNIITTDARTHMQTVKRADDPYVTSVRTVHTGVAGPAGTDTTVTTRTIPAGEPENFIYGCRTESSARCIQDTYTHKAMGIYDTQKTASLYPSAYFRMYALNLRDSRVSGYVNTSSPQSNALARNILPEYLDLTNGCNYMLVSPNQACIFALGATRFGIYKKMSAADISKQIAARVDSIIQLYQRLNFSQYVLTTIRTRLTRIMQNSLNVCGVPRFPSFERRFHGMFDVRAIIENSIFNVYSKSKQGGDEDVVCSLRIAPDNAAGPLAMVLDDSGKLSVYDRNNVEIVLIDADGNLNTGVASTDTGTTSPWLGNLGADLTLGLGGDEGISWAGFDTTAEFWRSLHNLKVYFNLVNDIVNNQIGYITSSNFDPPTELLSNLTEYDAGVDYVARYNACLDYLKNQGLIDYTTYMTRYIKTPSLSGSASTAQVMTLPGLDGSVVTPEQVLAALDTMDQVDDSVAEVTMPAADDATAATEAAEQQQYATNSNVQLAQGAAVSYLAGGPIDPDDPDIGIAPPFPVRSAPILTQPYTFATLFSSPAPALGTGGTSSGTSSGTGDAGTGDAGTGGAGIGSGVPGWDTQAEYIARMHSQFNI
jgi:hypothetical protein